MRIAVCDSDIAFMKKLKYIIYCYAEQMKIDLVVECFANGEIMLACKERYNIVFIGDCLDGLGGLEIAKKIRNRNNFSAIIFMSRNTDFVFEAFKVKPYRFLVLPISDKEIITVLDDFFEEFGFGFPVCIKSGEDTFCLNTSDIVYLEANNKHSIIHLSKENIACNKTMAKVYEMLPKNHFLKINRAYIINSDYVFKYNSDYVFLKNGKTLHISRNYYSDFKKDYNMFLNPRLL